MREDFLKELKEFDNYTFTENGAVALDSTMNACLDAFGTLGSAKDSEAEFILYKFMKAFCEDQSLAMRMLFYIRDVRGGQGMRRVFRIILRHLTNNYPELVIKNFDNILFYGRGDDFLCLLDSSVEDEMIDYCYHVLLDDLESVNNGGECTLLAKWMPSINTSSMTTRYCARKFIKGFGIETSQYRKMLSKLRSKINIVEALMSANEWDKIDFERLPSKAAMIYSDAFEKHVKENYYNYLIKLAEGNAKVNSKALFPVDIIHKVWNLSSGASKKDTLLLDAMWKALPDYFEDKKESGICVIDTSGSMWGTPIEVALSLGIYCADKAKGPFHNHFFTFSERPELQEVVGNNIVEKVYNLKWADWGMNTNIEAVFDIMLKTAVANQVPQEDLPSKLYIISDMQFDRCVGSRRLTQPIKIETFMESMAKKYAAYGYTLPAIVYWNVSDYKTGVFQQKFDSGNCCMVSGYSSSLFKSIIEGTEYEEIVNEKGEVVVKEKLDPMTIMYTTLNNERYDRVYTGV